MRKTLSAFTIVELILVISIIGILSTIGVVSYSSINTSSIDSKRELQAKAISEALEGYYEKNGEYPGCTAMSNPSLDFVTTNVLKGLQKDILTTPGDPDGTNSIVCGPLTDTSLDKFSYTGDSETCMTGDACLYYRLSYISESAETVEKIDSRHMIESLGPPPLEIITATGGTLSYDGAYTVRTFTTSGTLSITGGTLTDVSVLIVGGGANGSAANTSTGLGGNGGRGGQVVSLSNQSLTGDISVTVGLSNQNSSLGASSAIGGGGATGGIPALCVSAVDGVNGTQSSISGTSKYYGGGGGAGSARGCGEYNPSGGSQPGLGSLGYGADWYYDVCQEGYIDWTGSSGGTNNGGGGGGGGFNYDDSTLASGGGGSGVVIVRYLTPYSP